MVIKLKENSIMGKDKARQLAFKVNPTNDYMKDYQKLYSLLTRYYRDEVGIYNKEVEKLIDRIIVDKITADADNYPESKDEILDDISIFLKESKKRNIVSNCKSIRESKHRKLTEGPGAGYTIDWTLDNIYSVNADNVSVFLNRQEYSGASHKGSLLISCNVKCKAKCSVTINSASSYYYGIPNPIENVDAMITAIYIPIVDESYKYEVVSEGGEYVVTIADYWDERNLADKEISRHKSLNEAYDKILQLVEKEISDNINNEGYFYDLITDLANSEGRKFSYTYGGGWLHSTYDGTLSVIDENRYDYIDAELLDSDIIDFIDEAVQSENYVESYRITESSDDFDWCDTKEEVIRYIDEIGEDNVKWVEIIKEFYNEYGNIIDSEVGEDVTDEFI